MARRPLPDGSRRAEPTAAVPGGPGFALGGTLALPPPVCRTPLALPAGLNCALCPAAAAGALPHRALYRCVRGPEPPRRRPGQPHGSPVALEGSPRRGPPPAEEPAQQPNGHLPPSTPPPSLEQALGARLRHMGDHFHREQQQRRRQQQLPPRALWDHFYRFIFQLLGVFYNRPVEGALGLGPN